MVAQTRAHSRKTAASQPNDEDGHLAVVATPSSEDAPDRKSKNTMFNGGNGPMKSSTRMDPQNEADEIPRFRINLSLPPEQRYLEVCAALNAEMLGLTGLFDEVVGGMVPFLPSRWLKFFCRLFLRRVYWTEENDELKGISKATGVDMFLLVCFNVLLDLFMGCSSGGAAISTSGTRDDHEKKMVHFRTLDWGMDSLRKVVVQLDFINETGGPVIARSITYAGFVGVLTGVRKDLSMSLNFRPNRIDNGRFWADLKYTLHLLLVLLGKRPSISSHLRQCLLPHRRKVRRGIIRRMEQLPPPTFSEVITKLGGDAKIQARPIQTTACYLCFNNGKETTVIEKDRVSAVVRTGNDFIIVTNNDYELPASMIDHGNQKKQNGAVNFDATLTEIVEEAKDRLQCARLNWHNLRVLKTNGRKQKGNNNEQDPDMTSDDVVELIQKYPTTNQCTHFACVMDPTEGEMVWCRRFKEPISAKWIRAHMTGI